MEYGGKSLKAQMKQANRLGVSRVLSLLPALLDVFPAALLGRIVVIPYYPLSDEMIASIARLQLGRIGRRVSERRRVEARGRVFVVAEVPPETGP